MALSSCCFCIGLRRGSFISAYIVLVYNAVLLGMFTYRTSYILIVMKDLDEETRSLLRLPMLIFTTFIFILFVQLISSIIMLVGLHKKEPGKIFTSLVITGIFISIQVIIIICMILNDAGNWRAFGIDYAFICLYAYFLCVCASYRRQLCNQGKTIRNVSQP